MDFNLELPINGLSYGQMGFGVLNEIFERKLMPNIFPIGQVDISAYEVNENFLKWLNHCINKAIGSFNRKQPTIRLWHLNGSERRLTDHSVLWTAHETDVATMVESNIANCYDKFFTTSTYSRDIFKKAGVEAEWCPNFFDSKHLKVLDQKFIGNENEIVFGLMGKLERRKYTAEILQMWAAKYGNNPKYRLNALINNPFFSQEEYSSIINQIFRGPPPWNINLLPHMQRNAEVNQYYNSIDIDLSGLSGAEGWGLGCFNSLCLGKQAVVLNAHAHKDFANSENSILVESDGKSPIYDGKFFVPHTFFNQGNMFTFSQESFYEALETAEKYAKQENSEGMKLAKEFTAKKTTDILLNSI